MSAFALRLLDRPGGRGRYLFERNVMSHRRTWAIIVSGFFEPLFYLLALGYGLGTYVGDVVIDGKPIEYAAFVAPALLAASAFNGAFYDATNIFWKLRYQKVYDAVLATPLGPKDIASGETAFALFRGLIYAIGFFGLMLALGLIHSWWAVLALPATVFIGLLRRRRHRGGHLHAGWQDFDIPRPRDPAGVPLLGDILPARRGVRTGSGGDPGSASITGRPPTRLTTGTVGPGRLVNVACLTVLLSVGTIAGRRVGKLLLT
jgi:lipooligosaccharide transport system permease protein